MPLDLVGSLWRASGAVLTPEWSAWAAGDRADASRSTASDPGLRAKGKDIGQGTGHRVGPQLLVGRRCRVPADLVNDSTDRHESYPGGDARPEHQPGGNRAERED